MAYKINEIQGIGPSYAEKLAAAGITTTENLLEQGADAKGRKALGEKTGISGALLLKWANNADLMRISGIGPQFAELLEGAGVDTVKELRNRNVENLAAKMGEINEEKKLARVSPAASVVQGWIEQAKTTEPKISH